MSFALAVFVVVGFAATIEYFDLPDRARTVGGWAHDEDGDGLREVHANTIGGVWTGLRNFLRRFRGVHKGYLAQYVAIFEWKHNPESVTDEFLRMLRDSVFTLDPT